MDGLSLGVAGMRSFGISKEPLEDLAGWTGRLV